MAFDRARFYSINGVTLPSVTTVLDVINKPALGPWYAKEERRHFEAALLAVAAEHPTITADQLVAAVAAAVQGTKAADREKMKAATIGTGAHALIEWHTRRMLGEKVGSEPIVPDAAQWAVMAWQDWAKSVDFVPLLVEVVVHCVGCGYAGTADWIGKVRGQIVLGDYKTGKAIYPEAFLQNIAYRHAAEKLGVQTEAGLILRLPKVEDDPAFEVMYVPDDLTIRPFRAALALWRCQRSFEGRPAGGGGEKPCRIPTA